MQRELIGNWMKKQNNTVHKERSGLPMSSSVKREKGIGEEGWGAVGFWEDNWKAEEEGSPKGNASPAGQGAWRVGRLSFGANQRR